MSTAPSATPSATTQDATYTLADIRAHNTAQSCWAAVRGEVVDLTGWIAQHPGGPQRILNLCGTDATQAFNDQHGTSQRPNATLDQFRIGRLAQ